MIRCLLILSLLAITAGARAQTYERQRTARVMDRLGFEAELAPEGKRIAWIRIVRDEVFVKDEIWPTFLNLFHVTTRETVVRRELLFEAGESYSEARIEESMRNLRGIYIFALVRIVPIRLDKPGEVGVLVHTRDLWSLRLETSFLAGGLVLDQGTLNLVERNALGRNVTVGVGTTVLPQSYTLSQNVDVRRVFGTSLALEESASIIMNKNSGRAEGSIWELSISQPLYQLRQRFGWKLYGEYYDYVFRALKDGKVQSIDAPIPGPELPNPLYVWRQRLLRSSLSASYRFGEIVKHAFTAGWDARVNVLRPTEETGVAPELEGWFRRDILPKLRTELGPLLAYDMFTPRYAAFENLATYGMTENVRVGPKVSLNTRLPLEEFGSNTDSWVAAGELNYTHAIADALLDMQLEGQMRLEHDRLVDLRGVVVLRGASPVLFKLFRVVARSSIEARKNDTANTSMPLGGTNGLRGFESNALRVFGGSRFLTNIELRSLPIEWEAVHVGLVAFYDFGTVYNRLDTARLYHGAGVGLRILFPHANRTPFSFDAGFSRFRPFLVPTVSSAQVLPVTAAEDPE